MTFNSITYTLETIIHIRAVVWGDEAMSRKVLLNPEFDFDCAFPLLRRILPKYDYYYNIKEIKLTHANNSLPCIV